MPRDAVITYEQVAAAAEAIAAEGGRPTLRAVRERIGRGSMGTIQRLLSQWQAARSPTEPQAELPPAVQQAILAFVTQETASAKVELEQSLAEAQQAAADLAAKNEQLGLEIAELEQAIASEREARAKSEGAAARLAADLAATRAELARERQAAEALRIELAKAELRLEALPRMEAELERLREALEAERKARHEAEIELARKHAPRTRGEDR